MNTFMYAHLAYWIPLLPFLGFLVLALLNPLFRGRSGGWFATLVMAAVAFLASGLFLEALRAAPHWQLSGGEAELVRPALSGFPFRFEWPWLQIRGETGIALSIYIDQMAAAVVAMVAWASFFIHLFSIGYMDGEERYTTFFAYLELFTAAMLAFVVAGNFFHALLAWEVMGLMSYLLIGFFFKKASARQAMKKAFITTKFADLGFMLGLFWLYKELGTLDLVKVGAMAGQLAAGVALAIGLLLLLAAMGKSAQFPLHVWLLDAMEGPTPVSAMIHAATMVAAGVYLMARFYPVLEAGHALPYLAWVGAITALFAAVLGAAFADVKKILAWSTVSQLGYMFLGLGVFGWAAALFHLLAHAFFKALLFLGSGSMIHGAKTQDIFEMNRLARYMPITYATFLIGAAALMGLPPFAGFWSKDLILHAALAHAPLLWLFGITGAFFTAFYTTRMILIAFHHPSLPSPWKQAPWNRGCPALNLGPEDCPPDPAPPADHHPHESEPVMTLALLGLAGFSLAVGLWGSPLFGPGLLGFLYFGDKPELLSAGELFSGYALGTAVALAGLLLAVGLYLKDPLTQRLPDPVVAALQRRLYLDEVYYRVVGRVAQWPTEILWIFDTYVVDLLVDLVGYATFALGQALRWFQSGRFATYALYVVLGALALILGGVRW